MTSKAKICQDKALLAAHGAEANENEGWKGLALQNGWKIRSRHMPILSEPEHEDLVRWLSVGNEGEEEVPVSSCGSVYVRGTHLQLPEILFGNSALELLHKPSGFLLRFDARGALWHWVRLYVEGAYSVIKVPEAKEWAGNRHAREATKLTQAEYDWTWATDYPGWLSPTDGDDGASGNLQLKPQAALRIAAAAAPVLMGKDPLRTEGAAVAAAETTAAVAASSQLSASEGASAGGIAAAIGSSSSAATAEAKLPQWDEEPTTGIDRALLSDQRQPILLYDDVVLYEDFVHDHGVVSLGVKVRVMPTCWFVLLRYWVRIDGVVLKVFDTRYFHRFSDARVHRETTRLEATFAQLVAAGAPAAAGHYDDPQKAVPFLRPPPAFPVPVCQSLRLHGAAADSDGRLKG